MVVRLSLVIALLAPSSGLRLPTPLPGSIGEKALGRREAAALLASSMAAVLTGGTQAASAGAGSVVKLDMAVKTYVEVECPEALAQGRAGGALGAGAGGGGIAQKCVQVKAGVTNDSGGEIEGAGVFGRVEEVKSSMSVLGNGQDGKNDAGQFAMIDKIPTGASDIEFIFVAQQADDCKPSKYKDPDTGQVVFKKCPVAGTDPLVQLKFEKVKAIAYPNAKQFKVYDECEQNPFAEGCEEKGY